MEFRTSSFKSDPQFMKLLYDLNMYPKYKRQLKEKAQEYLDMRKLYDALLDGGNREIGRGKSGYKFLMGAESITEKRLAVAREMVEIRAQYRRIDFIMCRLRDLVEYLEGEEYQLFDAKYLQGKTWPNVSMLMMYDITTLHRKKNKILARLAPLYSLEGINEYARMEKTAAPQDKVLFPHSAGEKEGRK